MSIGLTIDDPVYFERLAHAGTSHWWSIAMERILTFWLDRALRGRSGLTAIDIGCGSGQGLVSLAARPEIARVVGVEPSDAALAVALHAPIVQGSALDLPIAANSVDVILCLDVMQHLPMDQEDQAAREIQRVLRPGGVAVIRANGRGLWPDRSSERPPYRLADLVDVFARTGLEVHRASYANCLPAVAAEVLGKLRPGSSHLGHPSGRGLRLVSRSGKSHALMSMISRCEAWAVGRLGVSLPVGHSTMILVREGKGGSR